MKTIVAVVFLIFTVHCYEGSTTDGDMVTVCPRLTCSEPLGDKVCFMHSSSNPVEWIKLMKCPKGYLCDSTQELAWFNTKAQSILGSKSPLKSPSWKRQTISKCEKYSNFSHFVLMKR
jgi:hypothetical protein